MIKYKVSFPEKEQFPTLSFEEMLQKEGIYVSVDSEMTGGDEYERYLVLISLSKKLTVILKITDRLFLPINVDEFRTSSVRGRFYEVDEEMSITFNQNFKE